MYTNKCFDEGLGKKHTFRYANKWVLLQFFSHEVESQTQWWLQSTAAADSISTPTKQITRDEKTKRRRRKTMTRDLRPGSGLTPTRDRGRLYKRTSQGSSVQSTLRPSSTPSTAAASSSGPLPRSGSRKDWSVTSTLSLISRGWVSHAPPFCSLFVLGCWACMEPVWGNDATNWFLYRERNWLSL